MRGITVIVVGAALIAVFLLLLAVMAWQEARTRAGPAEYILSDAVLWIRPRLSQQQRNRLSSADVLAILEWQVYFLQIGVRGVRRGEAEVVVGHTETAVAYVCQQMLSIAERDLDPDDVAAVLEGQGEYLGSIGAVGDAVDGAID